MVPTIPKAVSGLTKLDAPSAGVTSSGRTRQLPEGTVRYSPYIPPPSTATVLLTRAFASSPAATTTPAPSLPTGMALPTRAAIAPNPAGGTVIVVRRADPSPRVFAVDTKSQPPRRQSRSPALISAIPHKSDVYRSRLARPVPPGLGMPISQPRQARPRCGLLGSTRAAGPNRRHAADPAAAELVRTVVIASEYGRVRMVLVRPQPQ